MAPNSPIKNWCALIMVLSIGMVVFSWFNAIIQGYVSFGGNVFLHLCALISFQRAGGEYTNTVRVLMFIAFFFNLGILGWLVWAVVDFVLFLELYDLCCPASLIGLPAGMCALQFVLVVANIVLMKKYQQAGLSYTSSGSTSRIQSLPMVAVATSAPAPAPVYAAPAPVYAAPAPVYAAPAPAYAAPPASGYAAPPSPGYAAPPSSGYGAPVYTPPAPVYLTLTPSDGVRPVSQMSSNSPMAEQRPGSFAAPGPSPYPTGDAYPSSSNSYPVAEPYPMAPPTYEQTPMKEYRENP